MPEEKKPATEKNENPPPDILNVIEDPKRYDKHKRAAKAFKDLDDLINAYMAGGKKPRRILFAQFYFVALFNANAKMQGWPMLQWNRVPMHFHGVPVLPIKRREDKYESPYLVKTFYDKNYYTRGQFSGTR